MPYAVLATERGKGTEGDPSPLSVLSHNLTHKEALWFTNRENIPQRFLRLHVRKHRNRHHAPPHLCAACIQPFYEPGLRVAKWTELEQVLL